MRFSRSRRLSQFAASVAVVAAVGWIPTASGAQTRPEIPVPPPEGLAIDLDFTRMTDVSEARIPGVGGFFWDCEGTGTCPNDERAISHGGVTLVDDPRYGTVLRMHQLEGAHIGYGGTVKGRFNVPPDSAVWFQSMIRFAPNWDAAVVSSYKYAFFYLSNSGTQRISKCCPGPGTLMEHGFNGGTPTSQQAPLRRGSVPGGWISSNGWVRLTGFFVREGADITSGWLFEEVDGPRHTFHGGRTANVPVALAGANRTGHGPMVVYRVSQGENINSPPRQDTHIDYAYLRVWVGEKDPLGLLDMVR